MNLMPALFSVVLGFSACVENNSAAVTAYQAAPEPAEELLVLPDSMAAYQVGLAYYSSRTKRPLEGYKALVVLEPITKANAGKPRFWREYSSGRLVHGLREGRWQYRYYSRRALSRYARPDYNARYHQGKLVSSLNPEERRNTWAIGKLPPPPELMRDWSDSTEISQVNNVFYSRKTYEKLNGSYNILEYVCIPGTLLIDGITELDKRLGQGKFVNGLKEGPWVYRPYDPSGPRYVVRYHLGRLLPADKPK